MYNYHKISIFIHFFEYFVAYFIDFFMNLFAVFLIFIYFIDFTHFFGRILEINMLILLPLSLNILLK